MLLLLDEPTNHLDLEACVWLEEYLKTKVKTLVLVSHSQDFLNGVCTNIMHLHERKLLYYGGNYDTYVKTRSELEENQTKRYEHEQAQIADMKEYIARFGHGSAKLARQAQSKEKTLKKVFILSPSPLSLSLSFSLIVMLFFFSSFEDGRCWTDGEGGERENLAFQV